MNESMIHNHNDVSDGQSLISKLSIPPQNFLFCSCKFNNEFQHPQQHSLWDNAGYDNHS